MSNIESAAGQVIASMWERLNEGDSKAKRTLLDELLKQRKDDKIPS